MITVALASAYPTEADARAGIREESGHDPEGEYRGLWLMPTPERPAVHLFTQPGQVANLADHGWILLRAWPYASRYVAPWTNEELAAARRRAIERAEMFQAYVD